MPRELIHSSLLKQSPIVDELDSVPIVIVLGDDKRSVRAFKSRIDGRKLELYRNRTSPAATGRSETASEWDFSGKAMSALRQAA